MEEFSEQFKRHAELAKQREKSRETREKREEESGPDPAELQRWLETGEGERLEAPEEQERSHSPLSAVFYRRARHVK